MAYDAERAQKLRERLEKTLFSEFTADYALDICVVTDPDMFTRGLNVYVSADKSVERLEEFFKKRDNEVKKNGLEHGESVVADVGLLKLHATLNEPISIFEQWIRKGNARVRCRNVMESNAISTIGQFVQQDRHQILRLRNFGQKSLMSMEGALARLGRDRGINLEIGMDTKGWRSTAMPNAMPKASQEVG